MMYRNETISIAKGLAIFLMVLCHAGCPKWAYDYIYMFHMPLFFFVSGYCFKAKYLDTPVLYAQRKVKTIYWPYLKWSLLFLLCHNLFMYSHLYFAEEVDYGYVQHCYSLRDMALVVVNLVTRMEGHEQLLGGYWFLKELFFACLIMLLLLKVLKNRGWAACIVALAASVAGCAFNVYIPYLHIGSLTLMVVAIMLLGYVCAGRGMTFTSGTVAIVGLALFVAVGAALCATTMLDYALRQLLPYVVFAFAGSYMMMCISKKINDKTVMLKRVLVYVGDNTLTILTWHFLVFKLVSLIVVSVEGRPIEHLAMFPVVNDGAGGHYYTPWFALYCLCGITLPLLAEHIVRRYISPCLRRMSFKRSVPEANEK